MKLKVLYNTKVHTYRLGDVEMAPFSHPITFHNQFQPGWEKIPCHGGYGTWWMGCCYIRGISDLTRKQLAQILTEAEQNLNEHISGNTLEDVIQDIKMCMNSICEYIKTNSPISLGEVFWESHIQTKSIEAML